MKGETTVVSLGSDQVLKLPDGRLALLREKPADLETPLSVYLKLRGEGPSFLLESVSGGEQVARFHLSESGLNGLLSFKRTLGKFIPRPARRPMF